jgi:hypothetical protein
LVDFLVGLKGDDLLRGLVAVSRGRIPNFSGLVIGVGGNAMLNNRKKRPVNRSHSFEEGKREERNNYAIPTHHKIRCIIEFLKS